jgi:hypothetical protein
VDDRFEVLEILFVLVDAARDGAFLVLGVERLVGDGILLEGTPLLATVVIVLALFRILTGVAVVGVTRRVVRVLVVVRLIVLVVLSVPLVVAVPPTFVVAFPLVFVIVVFFVVKGVTVADGRAIYSSVKRGGHKARISFKNSSLLVILVKYHVKILWFF